jgi:hypothetical protein
MSNKRAYPAGQFMLTIDGAKDPTSYIHWIEGGHVKGNVIDEQHGADHNRLRHLANVECAPISLEMGMAVTKPWLKWIEASWSRKFERKTGAITYADFDLQAKLIQSFSGALISECTFPACDASDKKASYLGIKLEIEQSKLEKGGGQKIQPLDGTNQQKSWLNSAFRFSIDGMDTSMVNKIDSFKVTQKVKKNFSGKHRYAQLEPSGIEFPNITFYMATAYADDFIKWHNDFIITGDRDIDQYKTGSIEYMAPNHDDSLLCLDLYGMAINSLALEKAEAHSDKVSRVKIELSVERMEIDAGMPGLE